MFEKTTLAISRTVYAVLVCAALGWLGWVCLAHMTLGWAIAVFIPSALVLIALFAPAAMAISGLIGVLGGAIAALATRQKNAS